MEYKNKKRLYDYFKGFRAYGDEERELLNILEQEMCYHDIAWANVSKEDIADILGEVKLDDISEDMVEDVATIMGDNYQDNSYGVDLRDAVELYKLHSEDIIEFYVPKKGE